jgi:hypothetical protein
MSVAACREDSGIPTPGDARPDSVTDGGGTSAIVVKQPTAPARTSEAGGEVRFSVVLGRAPTAPVLVKLTSSRPAEGQVSPASLTFTIANWNAPQMVTVTGVDDAAKDGDQMYSITVGPASSTDGSYQGVSGEAVALTNLDDEQAGLVVSTASAATSEAGTEATFTVALQSRPSMAVMVAVASDDPSEGTVAPATLAFTPDNWNAPQTVTVTGVDDADADGRQDYQVTVGPVTSSDPDYMGLTPAKVALANVDNDSPGITVLVTPDLTTTEAGGVAEFGVILNSRPSADVSIAVSSSDTGEGTVAPASLTFTVANWSAPQTVTITGVGDDIADGNQLFTVVIAAATSTDTGYAGIDSTDVMVTNSDDDSAGVTVTPISGLGTTEAGGTATFTVVLNSQPSANATIDLTSSDTTEGTVAPVALTFTPTNWSAPQTVTVTGVNDDLADGNQTFAILTSPTASTDVAYSGLDPANVTGVTNTDNDSAGITVSPVVGLTTTEAGGTATFTVVLNSLPTGDVNIPVSSADTTEGTVSPAALTFTPANWNAPQIVTVTGVNDDEADGSQPYLVNTLAATSSDTGYAGLDAANVAASNIDNDSAGITVSAASGPTTEAGGVATFTVVLNSQPIANVMVGLSSNDTTEGTVSPASLTFTAANWNAPQSVTVTGANDDLADGSQPYVIVTATAISVDVGYAGIDAVNVSVTNTDNDTAGITVSAISGPTTEAGGLATFTVALNAQPTADVVIGLSSNDTGEGTVAPASLTFTSVNWASPQPVTVTGVNDDLADGGQPYSILTAAAVSTDTGYSGMDPANVAVTNTDNDSAGITVSAISGPTTEALGTATFTVALNSQPTADVEIALTSSDVGEGTVGPASLTFTSVNWASPQPVTVTGVNDDLADGSQPYSILTAAAVSADTTGYSGMDAANVAVSNTDNDSAGITVSAISGPTTEALGTATFTVVLNSQPTADVVIGLTSDDIGEGTVGPASLTFTSVSWASPQTVTVTGVNDDLDDGSPSYNIVTAAAVSTDTTGYSGLNAANVTVTNTDNDSAGITVSAISGPTTEALGTATFTVVLNSQPTADVVIGLASSDVGEGTVSPTSLTFTSVNWASPQPVTVTGVNDDLDDGSPTYNIVTAAAVSADTTGYSGMNAANVSVTNTDNDTAGITVSAISGPTTEDLGTATFTVVLNSQPTADVVIGLTSDDPGEGTVLPVSLTFTSVNWASPQPVTVTGVNDDLDDGSPSYNVVTAAAVSTDTTGYSGMNAANVSVTNTDNDTAGITVSAISGPTTEALGTATFTVVLNSQPTADVVIGLTSDDPGEGTVLPVSLTFTNADWNMVQTVTVTGVNDDLDDGNAPYNILTAAAVSTDTTGYSGMNAANVALTNTDNDSAGITVSAISGPTTEALGTATFTVVLNSQPTADVVMGLTSDDTGEGTVLPASLTFTSVNWATPQPVTVTGVNDDLDDGNAPYNIVTAAAVSADTTGYSSMDAANVALTNTDNDTSGFTVSAISGNTTEAGGTATFTVVLNALPTGNVVIGLSSSDTTEGTVAPAMLTFTTADWNMAQTVTVTGVDDVLGDGNVAYTIVTALPTGGDAIYNAINPANVSVTNTDDDEIRIFGAGLRDGALGGRAGADFLCSAAATGWAVGKTIRAFISITGTDEIRDMPANYGIDTTYPIKNLTGANTIANNWTDLLDQSIDMTLNAAGVMTTSGVFWISLSDVDGGLSADNCNNATTNAGGGMAVGLTVTADPTWMFTAPGACSDAANFDLLCLAF